MDPLLQNFMFAILKYIFDLFSPYVNKTEKRVDKFFRKINEKNNKSKIIQTLLSLMQEDLVILNLYLEKKYKGYKYLNKKNRKILYENKEFLKAKFLNFKNKFDLDKNKENYKIEYLEIVNKFFKTQVNYKYEEARNFGELFKDKQNIIGDCNQIVTLYIYLYSLENNIKDLSLRLFEDHVRLYLNGFDLECTQNVFCTFENQKSKIVNAYEIISINLLDVSDKNIKKFNISPKSLLEGSRIAFLLSSDKEITKNNLEIAYSNLAINFSKKHLYSKAFEFAKNSKNEKIINNILLSAVQFYLNKENFFKAKKYASLKKDYNLKNKIIKNEAGFYFKKNNLNKALNLFKSINDEEGIKACNGKIFLNLQNQFKNIKTLKDLKNKKHTLSKMLRLAKKASNENMIKYCKNLLKQI